MNPALAQAMCDMITKETTYEVIMVGKDGKIFAASARERIGKLHAVAKKVMDGVIDEGVVTSEEANESANIRAGINSPVKYNNETILVLGMSGDPKLVRPIMGITRQNIIMNIQSEEKIDYLNTKVATIDQELAQISEVVQQISGAAQESATESDMMVNSAEESFEKLEKMGQILEMIKSIATRTNIIGINAAIEAARVGDAGRGFSVVAKEVQNLAKSSDHSVQTISTIQQEIGRNVEDVLLRVKDNNEAQQEQATTLQTISNSLLTIEEHMKDIVQKMEQTQV